jgi:hypothetical protein
MKKKHCTHGKSRMMDCRECRRQTRLSGYDKRVGPSQRDKYYFAKNVARRRGLEFTLTFEQFAAIISRSCVYAIKEQREINPRIDRKDNALGYTLENSQSCCACHNQLKSDILSHEHMLDAVHRYQIPCRNARNGRKKLPRPGGVTPHSGASHSVKFRNTQLRRIKDKATYAELSNRRAGRPVHPNAHTTQPWGRAPRRFQDRGPRWRPARRLQSRARPEINVVERG